MKITSKMMIALGLLFFSLICFEAMAQKAEMKIFAKFTNADSVVLVSHISANSKSLIGKLNSYRIVNDNLVNKDIIVESYRLNQIEADSLARILIEENQDSLIQELGCFDPHHGILIYNNAGCSFFDICFGCRHFITSKDIRLADGLSDDTWLRLFRFFKNRKLHYELNGETIEQD